MRGGEFTKASLRVLAGNAELAASRVVSAEAGRTMTTALCWRDHHLLTDGQVFHCRAHFGDLAHDLAAADVRHGNLNRQSLARPQVEMIHPASPDADQHVLSTDGRDRQVHRLQYIDPPGPGESHGAHEIDSSQRSSNEV